MRARLALLAIGAALVVVGCGGDDSSSSSKSNTGVTKIGSSSNSEVPKTAKSGGSITYLASGDIDYLDPGQDYYTFGFMVQTAVNRALYGYKPDDSTKAVPDLAEGEPEISSDNKTITVHIRKGIKYAPPVNREVKSADVKYAIERAFTSNVPSGYSSSYFSDIEGAPSAPVKISALKDFAGLQTPDDYTLVIKLSKPTAGLVVGALAMPITVPVPKEYASKYDAKNPSTYDQYVAFTGPYMVKNDPTTGKVTGREPGKRIEIVRNPNWDKRSDYRPAYLDAITIDEGNSDLNVAGRRVLAGSHLMCCDSAHPPANLLKRLLTRYQDQLGRVPSGGEHWEALNMKIKPLDNVNIRKAIVAVMDLDALRKTSGGAAIGPYAKGYIPPGIPGFEESGGLKGFTDLDFMNTPPGGDPAVAKKYMDLAEKDGVPVSNGKYTGSADLQAVVANTPDALKGAEVVQEGFAKLGLKLKIKQVPQDTLYTKFLGVPKNEPAVGIGVGWVKDFQDPQTMLQPTFDGKAIKPAGNVNWSQLNDPAINQAMADAATKPAGPERNKAWADVNKMVVEQAATILETWDDNLTMFSKDVNMVLNGYTTSPDLSYSSIK